MGNDDFDALLRSAIAKRCDSPMKENLTALVIEKQRRRKPRISWLWAPVAAAATVAIIMVVGGFNGSDNRHAEQSVPSFYVEADALTELRLKESSAESVRLRNDIDELYLPQ